MLFDDLNNPDLLKAKPSLECSVCALRHQISKEEWAQLNKVIADPTVSKSAVARILTNNGHKVSPGTMTRHTRGECAKRA